MLNLNFMKATFDKTARIAALCVSLAVSFVSVPAVAYDWETGNHEVLVGDINQDGSNDVLIRSVGQNKTAELAYDLDFQLSVHSILRDTALISESGGHRLDYGVTVDNQISLSSGRYRSRIADFNEDGLEDVLLQPTSSGKTAFIVLGFKAGESPVLFQEINQQTHGEDLGGSSAAVSIQDANGDGRLDIVSSTSGSSRALLLLADRFSPSVPGQPCTAQDSDDSDCDGTADRYDAEPYLSTNNSNIDANLAPVTIGAIDASFDVNQDGKAIYSIPLNLVPAAGTEPGLALTYSQSGGNGVVGMGWFISGLSEITRCSTSIVQEGFVNGVNFNSSDQFCLNGQKLIQIAPNEYRTELETHTKIVASGSIAGDPEKFVVRLADGMIETYGGTSNARRLSPSAAQGVHSWALNRSEDREGNYSTYTYHNLASAGEFWISEIAYGGNEDAGQSANRKVRFETQARTDVTESFENSIITKYSKRIHKITTYLAASKVREYNLVYTSGKTNRSLVETVEECVYSNASSKACLPKTTLTWDKGLTDESTLKYKQQLTESGISANLFKNQQTLSGDVNGDGLSDIVWVYRNSNTLGRVVYLAQSSGDRYDRVSNQTDTGFIASNVAEEEQTHLLADVNGDGKSDLIWIARHNDTLVSNIYLANAAGTGFSSQGYEVDVQSDYSQFTRGEYITADVNGDNLQDLVWVYHFENKLGVTTYLAERVGTKVRFAKVSRLIDDDYTPDFYQNLNFAMGDVNGDKKDDLVWTFSYQSNMYRALFLANASGSGFVNISLERTAFTAGESNHQTLLGDVNADGKADLVWLSHKNSRISRRIFLSARMGNQFFAQQNTSDTSVSTAGMQQPSGQLVDINGDGRSDLVYSYINGTSYSARMYLSNMDGKGFSYKNTTSRSVGSGTSNHHYRFGDISGDGKADLVHSFAASNANFTQQVFEQDQSYPDHIELITDGLGNTVDIDYRYLADSTVYTQGSAVSYPLRNDPGLSFVVANVKKSDGIGGLNEWRYAYKGARTHLTGRGFVGFEERSVAEVARGLTSTETYHQSFPFINELKSASIETDQYTIQHVDYDWQSTNLHSGKTVFPYLKKEGVIKRALTNGVEFYGSVTTNAYNVNYGLVDNSTTVIGLGYANFAVTNLQQTVSTVNEHDVSVSNWRLAFLEKQTKTYSVPGTPDRTEIHEYTPYSASSYLVKTEKEYVGSAVERTKTYVRDDFGNITSVTLTGKDIDGGQIAPQVETVNAYIDGVYADESTNALLHTEQHIFDKQYGTLLRKVDANERVMDTVTDGFGNPLRERSADGTVKNYSYALCASNCGFSRAVYKVTQTVTHPLRSDAGAPETVVYLDKQQREVATTTKQPNNKLVNVTTEYDRFGRVKQKSQPYHSGSTVHNTGYNYDVLDRLVYELRPDGGKTETTFRGNSTFGTESEIKSTVIIPSKANQVLTSRLYQNALGQLRRSFDANNTKTDYFYDAHGNMRETKIADNNDTKIVITTDVAGNRTQINDPNAGLISFEYDGAFRERRRTYGSGAGSHATTTSYDKLGRMTARVDNKAGSQSSAAWTYDPVNALGAVHSASASEYHKSYTYDRLARVKSLQVKILNEAQPKDFEFGYDEYSRLTNKAYPNNINVAYAFNSLGYKDRVENADSGKAYWSANGWDAYGNVTQEAFGNGVTTVSQYTANMGRIQSRSTTNLQSMQAYQGLSYLHDSAGNLRSRKTAVGQFNTVTETFDFDNLHRLTSAVSAGLASGTRNLTYLYDVLGNIKTKSDVSDTNGYSYGAGLAGVNAVSSIAHNGQTTSYGYDFKGNMTTRGNQTIEYSVFNKPTLISEVGKQTQFFYGPDRGRFYQVATIGSTQTRTYYYAGDYELVERDDALREKAYIDDFLVIARETSSANATKLEDHDYLHRDHLGSVEATSDRFGHFTGRMAFDAWGQRREDNWETASTQFLANFGQRSFASTTRGFTNHEHLDGFGLIHMNGRVYDPIIGRFLSPDDFIQHPENSQHFNRYSYVWNNPISYTDPSGEAVPVVIGAVWAGIKIYEAVSTAYDSYKTITDENMSTSEKALTLSTSVALAVVPVPKAISKRGGRLLQGQMKASPSKQAQRRANRRSSKQSKGTDKNTTKAEESKSSVESSPEISAQKPSKAPSETSSNSGSNLPVPFDGEFALMQLQIQKKQYLARTPKGRQVNFHAADRMVNPPKGRVAMTLEEVDQVLDEATKIRKRSFHPAGNTLTIRNDNMSGRPDVVVDEATGSRVISVIKNRRKRRR